MVTADLGGAQLRCGFRQAITSPLLWVAPSSGCLGLSVFSCCSVKELSLVSRQYLAGGQKPGDASLFSSVFGGRPFFDTGFRKLLLPNSVSYNFSFCARFVYRVLLFLQRVPSYSCGHTGLLANEDCFLRLVGFFVGRRSVP